MSTLASTVFAAFLAASAQRAPAQALDASSQPGSGPVTTFSEEITLRDLAVACAHALDVPLEFDPSTLVGNVRMVPLVPYTAEQALRALERELLARALTTVSPPGADVLRIVPLGEAASLARLEEPMLEPSALESIRAGFVKVLLPLSHRSLDEVAPVLQALLSKPGGVIAPVKDSATILIADLRPNVVQIANLLEWLDRPNLEPELIEVSLEHTTPVAMAALIERVTSSRKTVANAPLEGTLLALPENRSVLIVAPSNEVPWWQETIARFDRPEPVSTQGYQPLRFSLSETADLLQEVVRPDSAGESSRAWKVVQDELTGSLIITTTPSRHAQVREILDRLEAVSPEGRRPMRVFAIRHRQVQDVLQSLNDLLAAGALNAGPDSALKPPSSAQTQGVSAPLPDAAATARVANRTSVTAQAVTLSADEGTNRLIAFGPAPLLDQLGQLVSALDERHPQVMVEALVLSLSKSQTRALGVELQRATSDGSVQIGLSNLFGLGSPNLDELTIPPASGTGFSGLVLEPGEFSVLVRALESLSNGRSLTMPKLLVGNNQVAKLDSTLQTPFASTNASTTVATTSFGGTFDAGTSISLKPQVSAGDQVVLDYSVSISAFVGAASDPALPPPRAETKLSSVVTVPDGSTVVVGGLEIEGQGTSSDQVPWLGSIPLLGAIFSDRSKTESKNRFFVFLRCNVVNQRGFEDLRWTSSQKLEELALPADWPELVPRIMR